MPGFTEFEQRAVEALNHNGPEPAAWIVDRPDIDVPVAIIGSGHSGAAIGLALRRA